MSVSVEGYLR